MDLHITLQIDGVARRLAIDPRFGHVVNNDFANCHIPASAGVLDLDAIWLGQADPRSNRICLRGIGEIGAAIANAVWHATGIRVREWPITPDKVMA